MKSMLSFLCLYCSSGYKNVFESMYMFLGLQKYFEKKSVNLCKPMSIYILKVLLFIL